MSRRYFIGSLTTTRHENSQTYVSAGWLSTGYGARAKKLDVSGGMG